MSDSRVRRTTANPAVRAKTAPAIDGAAKVILAAIDQVLHGDAG